MLCFRRFFTRVSRSSFTRVLRSSTGGAGFSAKFYEDSTELYGWHQVSSKVLQGFYAVCVFASFARVLRSSTGVVAFSSKFYEGSTELYGWLYVFSNVLRGFYGALRVALCVFAFFTRALRSSTGGVALSSKFHEGSTELDGWH